MITAILSYLSVGVILAAVTVWLHRKVYVEAITHGDLEPVGAFSVTLVVLAGPVVLALVLLLVLVFDPFFLDGVDDK